jgi:hypothetical protein
MDSNGMPDIYDTYRAYHEGYTIVVNQVHRRSAAVALLCRALEVISHHEIGANLYLTPRDGQGFLPHVDTHDVFVLQLHGVKEWHVAGESSHLPLASAKHTPLALFADFRKLTLGPGDVLYIPRGFPHEAVTSNCSSLHLTVGVHVFTWVDLVTEVLGLLAEQRVELRGALPLGFLDVSLDAARVSELANSLAVALTDSTLVERAKGRLGSRLLRAGKTASKGHFRAIDMLGDITDQSILVRAPGVLCRVWSTSHECFIDFGTNYVAAPLFVKPAFRFIAEREQFTVSELPGILSAEDRKDLVIRLVSEGLLTPRTTDMEVI